MKSVHQVPRLAIISICIAQELFLSQLLSQGIMDKGTQTNLKSKPATGLATFQLAKRRCKFMAGLQSPFYSVLVLWETIRG